jgi:hypothetical protein
MLTLRADETHVRGFESAPIRSDDRQRCPEQPWRPAAERLASRAIGTSGTFLLPPSAGMARCPVPGSVRYLGILVGPLTPRGWPLLAIVVIDAAPMAATVSSGSGGDGEPESWPGTGIGGLR